MATSFPTYPATTFEQAVELAIFSSNQLHNIINADPLSTVETEDGDIPSVRKALIDNLYFKTPAITWAEGTSVTVFNQLYKFSGGTTGTALWYAPTATTTNPITMGSSPEDDANWKIYGWDTYSKSELNSTSGASYVGTSTGSTVQADLDLSDQFSGAYEDGLLTVNSTNRWITYNGRRWYVKPGTVVPFTTTGVNATSWENDSANFLEVGYTGLRLEMSGSGGASLSGLRQGGTIQDAIINVYVDAFGADNTGTSDSTSAVLAAIAAIGGPIDSAYVPGTTKYANVIFGNGKYIIGDIPFISGVYFKGQGEKQTQIIPKSGASYCFTTTGTKDYYSDTTSWETIKRCMSSGLFDLSIMPFQPGESGSVVANTGGVNIAYASYFKMQDIAMDNLGGTGLNQLQLWDSDISQVRITACGESSTDDTAIPSLYLGPGSTISEDGSNAVRYWGLHLENSKKLFSIDSSSRHIFFDSPKIEGSVAGVSSTITKGMGVVFNAPEFTWQYSDTPMMVISGTSDTDSSPGVVMSSPVFISGPQATNHGYYILHSSTNGVLLISDFHAEQVKTLVTGDNINIIGGTSYQCGPAFISSGAYLTLMGTSHREIIAGSETDGTDDFVQISGGGHNVRSNRFDCAGSSTDGLAYINATGVTSASFIRDNILGGTRQYGIRQNTDYPAVMVIDNLPIGTIASVNSIGFSYDTTREQTTSISVDSDSSATTNIKVTSCSLIRISFASSTGAKNSSAVCLGDINTTAVIILGTTGTGEVGRFRNGSSGTGDAGDGLVYLLRLDSGYIQITNHSGESGVFTLSSIDNHF